MTALYFSLAAMPLCAQAPLPSVCKNLAALLQIVAGGPSSERTFDTDRIQSALDECPSGERVELASAGANTAFLTGPITLPQGVTLWIDAGVTVFASRNATNFGLGHPHALLTVGSRIREASPAAIGGWGVIDGRGGAVLLTPASGERTSWLNRGTEERPDLIDAQGPLQLSGVTLRDAPGTAVRSSGSGTLLVDDLKIIGRLSAPDTRAVAVGPAAGNVRITGSAFLASTVALEISPGTALFVDDTKIYGGSVVGLPSRGSCVLNASPVPACAAAALPPMLGELILTGPHEIAAILTVPDTSLPDASGHVDLLDDGKVVVSATISSSAAIFGLDSLPPGPHRLHARLTSNGFAFGNVLVNLDKPKPSDAPPNLTLTASATTFPYGTSITLTAALPSATGAVSFLDGGTTLGQALMSGGMASLRVSRLSLGPHTVTALYAGDSVNPLQQSPPLSLQVNPVTTILSLGALPAAVPYGTTLNLSASVLPVNATGTIVFHDGAETIAQGKLQSGSATSGLSTLLPGVHPLTATYAGDVYDLPATSSIVQVTVLPITTWTALTATPSSAAFGSPIQLSILVSPADATGGVTVLDGTSPVQHLVLAAGSGTVQLPGLTPGLHAFTASYTGDALHRASDSSTVAVQITRVATATALLSLPSSIPAHSPVQLSATVTPASAAGTATFSDGNAGLLGQAPVSAGVATLPLASLPYGPHSITASYSGDGNDAPSISPPVSTSVPLASSTLVISGPGSIPYSAPATLMAAVLPASASGAVSVAELPSGTLGTILLTGGQGTFALGALAPGTHHLQAQYSGDPGDLPATATLSLTVTPDSTSTILTPAQGVVTAGAPILLNVTVATPYAHAPGGSVKVRVSSGAFSTVLSGMLLTTLPGQSFVTVAFDSNALGLGVFSAQATYAGDANDLPSGSPAVVFSVEPTPTTLTLQIPSLAIPSGIPSTVAANVSSPAGIPTGVIAFFRDGVLMAALPVVNGTVSTMVPALNVGTYAITATFQPTGLFAPATAPAQILTVTPPVAISLNPGTLMMKPGAGGSSVLSILPLSGYAGGYAASCAATSAYVSCTVSPGTGSVPASATVSIHTAANTYTQAQRSNSSLPLFALLLPGLILVRRHRRKALALVAALTLLAGCGQGTFFDIPAGSYPVTVSVTAAGSTATATLHIVLSE